MNNTYNNLNRKSIRNRRQLLRKKKKRRRITVIAIITIIIGIFGILKLNNKNNLKMSSESKISFDNDSDNNKEVLISVIGDLTLGTDEKFGHSNSFPEAFDNNNKDYLYFMKNVVKLFETDDYTIGNLETTFTDSKIKVPKGGGVSFNFKGQKDYANILKYSSIEGVTISNNHIYDYGVDGMKDTVSALEDAGIDICGEEYKIVKDIKGIKFGFLGYMGWNISDKLKDKIVNDIRDLRNKGVEVIIPYFHWGSESEHEASKNQVELARFSIDSGADAVIGSHPHVIQTIENYKGKIIAYSMGNFCFGGNFNPEDKRTFILQIKVNLKDKKLNNMEYKIIPTMISSRDDKNDYVPTIAKSSKEEILELLNELSPTLNNKIIDGFFTVDN
ncbi:CapA family protein [Clostridium botulinum]|uniref:CapA family protein n=1 Tax=Clostridium botulinum TaxID=1491 RepID=UPI0013FA8B4A|nr:CapA family protein [Clostridium botulinum]NFO04653.1 CapA family protein [Clostridium botulinum]NFO14452.1 CapA family protein [Clostridium botulinum]UZP03567.1 CapA family protein [Clostridium botulinum]UZP06923.1 CapA family protein [Clostridium botulinum]UZP10305.1 CapA family protein [Clostridium botulinum]